jgi:hypothetical protein
MVDWVNRIRWISDDRARKFVAEGFWRFVVYRGLLRFGTGGALLVVLIGLLLESTGQFEAHWWKAGSVWFLVGGLTWGAAVWLVLGLPTRWREAICWVLAIAIAVFVGAVLFTDVFP